MAPVKKGMVFASALLCAVLLCGCGSIGDKNGTVVLLYAASVAVSVVLLACYCLFIRPRDPWFVLMLSAICVVNTGYLLLSLSTTLPQALNANRLSYLGSAMLPLCLLMIVMNVCGLRRMRGLVTGLSVLALIIFLVAASPGYLDIYYSHVDIATVGGITVLRKEYGPWHSLYLFYLLGYFGATLATLLYARRKKTAMSPIHAALLFLALTVNILVWLVEQLVHTDFELLSVSYIISGLFLLLLYFMLQHFPTAAPAPEPVPEQPPVPAVDDQLRRRRDYLYGHLADLTPAERTVYDLFVQGRTTPQILEELHITQNTLKYHSRNIFGKLDVASRKELRELALLPTQDE